MNLKTLSQEDRRALYENFKDDYLLLNPGKKVPDMQSFFGDLEPAEEPSFWKRLYHTFF